MKNRNYKVRVLASALAAMMIMSQAAPLTAKAVEPSDEGNAEVTEIVEIAETTEEFQEEIIFEEDWEEETEEPGDEVDEALELLEEDDEDIEWEEETEEPGYEVDEALKKIEEEEKKKKEDKEKLPPKYERIFGEVNGEFVEFLIHSQEDYLNQPWIDEEGNEYTRTENYNWMDRYGNIYFEDKNYVDSYYGEHCYGDPADTAINECKKITQSELNAIIDYIAKSNPEFMLVAGPLKTIIGEIFGIGPSKDPNAVIVEKLTSIEDQLKTMESNQKYHLEATMTMSQMGRDFQNLKIAIGPLEKKIGDATKSYNNGSITEDEYNKRLAVLYNSTEYGNLMAALDGATHDFNGDTNYTIDETTIFGAAYNLECTHVMFSGEAIDRITPYLIRQLGNYLKGYALINTVLDGYEATVGNDAAEYTREEMFNNIGGVFKGEFDESRPGVFGQYKKFFEIYDRYIFVDMSCDPAKHVKLNKEILVIMGFSERMIGKGQLYPQNADKYTPDCLRNYPLNATQMAHIADYAANRNISIYDLLLDNVGFKLNIMPDTATQARFGFNIASLDENSVTHHLHRGEVTMKHLFETSDLTYMPGGPQTITAEWPTGVYYSNPNVPNTVTAIKINQTGSQIERITIGKSGGGERINAHMFFFTR